MSKSRAKGTAWESRVVTYLRGMGFDHADRSPLRGSKDTGDVTGVPGVIECKNEKAVTLSVYLDELEVEKANANVEFGFVVFPRRSHSIEKGYCLMPLGQLPGLLVLIARENRMDPR